MTNLDFSSLDDLFAGLNSVSTVTEENKFVAEQNVTENLEANTVVEIQQENSANNINVLQSAQAKMIKIEQEMNETFVEREELIKLMLLSVSTGNNLLMLGPPGCGKSAISYDLCNRINNANYFQWMLNKTSDPSEILGPFSVKEMENDKFMRVTAGKLPEAHIAFIDETYKSNAPTLNALLTIMNEKIFYNDGKPQQVPLVSMFGASNEPPEEDSLMALHDRFIFRMNVEYVHDASNKKKMFDGYLKNRANSISAMPTTITLNELKALQDAGKNVKISKNIINSFIRLINDLEKQAIYVSDRRQNECLKVLQGSAVLNSRDNVIIDDFIHLVYVLWEKEEDIPVIRSAITKMINPFDDKFNDMQKLFNKLQEDFNSITDPDDQKKTGMEVMSALNSLNQKVNKLIADASKAGKSVEQFTQFRQDISNFHTKITQITLGVTTSDTVNIDEFNF